MRILFVGDIFGRPGRRAVVSRLMRIKAEYKADFCIANGENAAGGKGITFDVRQGTLFRWCGRHYIGQSRMGQQGYLLIHRWQSTSRPRL